jgi:serine/threonine protein kinase
LARTSLRESDPARIGQYRLSARLGSGGMGVVYLGVAPDGGLVAVKVLRPELADDPEFRRRFGREVTVLMRVRGVCTVRVIEADTDSAWPFMVTEYADGPSLAEYIDTYGPLSPEMLYGLATGLAEALTVIHAAGIVHRDLKPSNVILTHDGPKVIDFGIAQTLDATSVTSTGMMVGSAGFMAPEQVSGRPGPAADIFVWGVTVGYAAAGHSPFGTGDTNAILYRVLYADPDIAAVPEPLKPLVEAALAKDPQNRPAAHELLDRLTSTAMRPAPIPDRLADTPTQTVLSLTWQQTGPYASQAQAGQSSAGRRPASESRTRRPPANGSLLLEPARPGTRPRGPRKVPVSRRTATIGVSAVVLVAVAILAVALMTGRSPKVGSLAANPGGGQGAAAAASLPIYPGQQQRGVFQTINRIVGSGRTMVTTGSQTSDGVVRQQFFASSDGGATWHLAPVQVPGGGQPPLGDVATRIAGGPNGWMAEGQQAIWTSRNGLSWTLAATHGITPQLPGDQVFVVTNTASGFVAAGLGRASGTGNQAVIWASHDGVTWQRTTAAQLGLMTAAGQTPQAISYATTHANDTVISDGGSGVWLSTDGGSAWTPVTVPVDHGAQDKISGVSFDGSGLIAVRPGFTASNTPDGVAYFSPNGQAWRYAGTIDPAGGWSPGVVKGGDDGFVVTGAVTSQKLYVAYTSTGTGTTWLPTGSLGDTSSGPTPIAAVGSRGIVVAVGSTNPTKISQQAVFLKANTAGKVSSVSLAGIPGGLIPEVAVNDTAVAGGEQIAVGSANGYPAVWRRAPNGTWSLVSSLSLVSGTPGLAALSSVTHGSAGWVTAGTPGPVIFTSADGTTWQPAGGNITQDLAGVAAVATASGPAGYLIDGKLVASGGACVADDWWSSDLTSWTRAHTATPATGSSQVLAVAAGAHGFVTAGSHNDKPAVWTTTDGRLWKIDVLPLPTGASAGVLQQVAISGNRVVALGQQTTSAGTLPLAELSTDGGTTWQPMAFISAGPNTAVTALTDRSGGFTAAGQFGAAGQQGAAVWTLADGQSWTQSQVSGLVGGGSHDVTTLARAGSAVTGIDSVETQAGQQFVTKLLG